MDGPGLDPRRPEGLAVRVVRSTEHDDEQPTSAAQLIYLVREQQAEETEEDQATPAAKATFRSRWAEASTQVPGRHAPQLLDTTVFSGGTVGIVAGPAVTVHVADPSTSAWTTEATCGLEVAGIIVGMMIYRFRRR